MIIRILIVGKTSRSFLREGISLYLDRLKHYGRVEYIELPDVSSRTTDWAAAREKEGEAFLKQIRPDDFVVLLDEKGQEYSSTGFATWLNKRMNSGTKNLVLVIGGSHGFSQAMYLRAQEQISFSRMTFSHEMIRLFLVEQLYRAFTILRGEGYHHD